jgi:hypothetical protein
MAESALEMRECSPKHALSVDVEDWNNLVEFSTSAGDYCRQPKRWFETRRACSTWCSSTKRRLGIGPISATPSHAPHLPAPANPRQSVRIGDTPARAGRFRPQLPQSGLATGKAVSYHCEVQTAPHVTACS